MPGAINKEKPEGWKMTDLIRRDSNGSVVNIDNGGTPATCAGLLSSAPAIRCPACGGANAPDAVFCANDECGKALGPFRYVHEELDEHARWHERVADRVSGFISRPHFFLAHSIMFAAWLAINTGVVAFVGAFDNYPFNLLALVISVEALFITGFVLISQNRQNAHADKRGELDYEVNVRTYREISEVKALLRETHARLESLERRGRV